jgi:hypothetical protein
MRPINVESEPIVVMKSFSIGPEGEALEEGGGVQREEAASERASLCGRHRPMLPPFTGSSGGMPSCIDARGRHVESVLGELHLDPAAFG